LKVHNGPLGDEDRTWIDGLPVLGLERTVTDLICAARPPDAVAIVDQALGAIEPSAHEPFRAAIARRLRCRRDPRGTVRGLHLLDLATGRAESPAESRLLWQIVDAGFPIPEVNLPITALDGRELYRLDLAWPEHLIVVEYHGYAAHVGRTAEDAARADDLRRRGWIVIEVWLDGVRDGRVSTELDAAFARRGVDTSRRQLRVLSGRRHRDPVPTGSRPA